MFQILLLIIFIISVHSKPIDHIKSNDLNDNISFDDLIVNQPESNRHFIDLFNDNLKSKRIPRDSSNVKELDESKKYKNIKKRDEDKKGTSNKGKKKVDEKNRKDNKIKKADQIKDDKLKSDKIINEKADNSNKLDTKINLNDKKQTTPQSLEITKLSDVTLDSFETKSTNLNQNNASESNKTKILYRTDVNDSADSKNEFTSTTKSIDLLSSTKLDELNSKIDNLNENKLNDSTKSIEQTIDTLKPVIKEDESTTSIAKLDDQKINSNTNLNIESQTNLIDSTTLANLINETQSSVKELNETQLSNKESNETQLSNKEINETQLSNKEINETQLSNKESNETQLSNKEINETQLSNKESNETQLSNKETNQTDLTIKEELNKTESSTKESTQIRSNDKNRSCVKVKTLNKDDEDYVDEIESTIMNDRRKYFRSRNLETHNQQSKFLIDLLGWVCIAAFGFIIGILIGLMVFSSN